MKHYKPFMQAMFFMAMIFMVLALWQWYDMPLYHTAQHVYTLALASVFSIALGILSVTQI